MAAAFTPRRLQVSMTLHAISPLLAMSTLSSTELTGACTALPHNFNERPLQPFLHRFPPHLCRSGQKRRPRPSSAPASRCGPSRPARRCAASRRSSRRYGLATAIHRPIQESARYRGGVSCEAQKPVLMGKASYFTATSSGSCESAHNAGQVGFSSLHVTRAAKRNVPHA